MSSFRGRDALPEQRSRSGLNSSSAHPPADFQKMLNLLEHFTADWPGDRLDDSGLIHIINRTGARPPLIWCFNARHEFEMLGGDLGLDQPVIGLRSLNLVARVEPGRPKQNDLIADHYSNLLFDALDIRRCSVGGNCQAAPIASRIAANGLCRGRTVDTLITMEVDSYLPFPGRCGLIFGAQSTQFNPFLRGDTPEPRWRALFAEPVLEIVPGGHGQYFTETNRLALAQAIARILKGAGARGAQVEDLVMTLDLINPPEYLPASSLAHIPVSIRSAFGADAAPDKRIQLNYVWISPDYGPSHWGMTELSDPSMDSITIAIKTPKTPGPWDLHLFPGLHDKGPISWMENHAPKGRISIQVSEG